MPKLISLLAVIPLSFAALFGAEKTPAAAPKITKLEPRVWQCEFTSPHVPKPMNFLVVLPEGADLEKQKEALPVIYFLHGRGRNERTLLDKSDTCRARLMASKCAVVLPKGREGWYVNSPVLKDEQYADYVDEVIALAEKHFPVGGSAQKRAIGGWSMGGYGAAYTATRRPDDFCALASIIGVINFPREQIEPKGQNYAVHPRYGEDRAFWDSVNPYLKLESLAKAKMPVFIAYAKGAPERQMNESFIEKAKSLSMDITVLPLDGGHMFPVVEKAYGPPMDFLEKHLQK